MVETLFAECNTCRCRGIPRSVKCHACGSLDFDIYYIPDTFLEAAKKLPEAEKVINAFVRARFKRLSHDS